jgi:hypothetical protein
MKYGLWIVLAGSLFHAAAGQGAVIDAASCSQTDVQTAVDAAGDGDTVAVPEGSCSWTTPAAQTPAVTIEDKSISLEGGGIGVTVITDATGEDWKETALWVQDRPCEISGFTFVGSAGSSNGIIQMENTGGDGAHGFRIHHNEFSLDAGYAILTRQLSYGLIDHNSFATSQDHTMIAAHLDGLASWSRPSSLGTADAVYIEDNTFLSTAATANYRAVYGQRGARFVFRHNTVTNLGVDMHGHCGDVGTFSYEVYDNDFVLDAGVSMFRWMFIRGGSGVVYNNTMTSSGDLARHLDMTEYRLSGIDSCSGDQRTCCVSYPCFGQIGRGTDQALVPLYYWNNAVNGSDALVTVNQVDDGTCAPAPDIADYIQLGRDYYVGAPAPDYHAYEYPHPLALGDVEPEEETGPEPMDDAEARPEALPEVDIDASPDAAVDAAADPDAASDPGSEGEEGEGGGGCGCHMVE